MTVWKVSLMAVSNDKKELINKFKYHIDNSISESFEGTPHCLASLMGYRSPAELNKALDKLGEYDLIEWGIEMERSMKYIRVWFDENSPYNDRWGNEESLWRSKW